MTTRSRLHSLFGSPKPCTSCGDLMSPGRVGKCTSCNLDDDWRATGRRDGLADADRKTRREHLRAAHRDRRAELYCDAYVAALVERAQRGG